jgi:hypothetical protein
VEHVDELISGQALHALSPDEEEQVALHVAECERCRRQLRESEAVAASLAYAVPAVAPPPDLRRRVLESVAPVVEAPAVAPVPARAPARRAARWWPRFAAVAVPVLAAAVVGLVVWNVSLQSDLSSLQHSLFHGSAGNLRERQRHALRERCARAGGEDLRGLGDPRQGGAPGRHLPGRRHRQPDAEPGRATG